MKRKITLLLLAICLLFGGRCTKDNCAPCGDDYKTIPQEMKDWALFEDGSWWVYRLAEDTTVFDTVRVSPDSKRFFRSNQSMCSDNYAPAVSCSEVITYNLQHSNTDYFPYGKDSTRGSFDEVNLYYPYGGGVFLSYQNGKAQSNAGVIFGIPIILSEKYGFHCLADTFEIFTINHIQYNNIFLAKNCYNTPDTDNFPESMQEVYWAKNIGLVKIKLINAQKETNIWELINYEIKQ